MKLIAFISFCALITLAAVPASAQSKLKFPLTCLPCARLSPGQTPTSASPRANALIRRSPRFSHARGCGQTGAREQPRHRGAAHRPSDLRRQLRQHPLGLQPHGVVAHQQPKLDERVNEHHFGWPDRRHHQQLHVRLQRRPGTGRAVGWRPNTSSRWCSTTAALKRRT